MLAGKRPPRAAALAALLLAACSHEARLSASGVKVLVHGGAPSLSVRDGNDREVLAVNGFATTKDHPHYEAQLLPGWDGYRAHEDPWKEPRTASLGAHDGSRAELRDGALSLVAAVTPGAVQVVVECDCDKLALRFRGAPGERFFGLGERFASLDHTGLSLYSWAEEGSLSLGEGIPRGPSNPYPNGPSMTYFPVPFAFSTAGYGVWLRNSERSEFDLTDGLRVVVNGQRLELTLYLGEPLEVLRAYTADSGRPPVPVPWAFGPRRTVGLGQTALGQPEWKLLRDRHVPTTALDDNLHFLPHRSELGREEELRAWVAQLHGNGFKVLAYATPYLSQTEPAAASDLQEGMQRDYFVKGEDGAVLSTFFSSGVSQRLATIDLTNPAAFAWFQDLLRRPLALGYDGWMHDFGEYLPRAARLHDGRTGAQAHNDFPLLSAKAASALPAFFFVRSGFAGTQAYAPAVWSGDPEASFDDTQGLPANLRAGLSLGLSGVPYWGSDISGYKCLTDAPHDKELYLRWAEVGAVSPIMMDDTACVSLTTKASKWTLWSDDETVQTYASLARLHTRLQPYFLTLAREANESGIPLMRAPVLLYPHAPEAQATDDAFFLGPALYAAPVVHRGDRTRRVWLPPGRWVDFESGQELAGDAFAVVDAPLVKLPLFLKAGELLPLLDAAVETLADGLVHDLDVRVALAAGQEARLLLVDGTQLQAARGADGAVTTSASGGPVRAVRFQVQRLP